MIYGTVTTINGEGSHYKLLDLEHKLPKSVQIGQISLRASDVDLIFHPRLADLQVSFGVRFDGVPEANHNGLVLNATTKYFVKKLHSHTNLVSLTLAAPCFPLYRAILPCSATSNL